ncbi:MAG: pyridoxamine 5'-phosphate oxidase family protein [Phycisphaeraceae bacterium]|nr:pyridoxamine 5'-phosphate oxidase family protein [Phycisphaeraceae bacterium]
MPAPEITLEQAVAAARQLIAQRIIGVLTTVDPSHVPHSRWMLGALPEEGLSPLLSLSARGARKLDHLDTNPNVCWLFSDDQDNEVVSLLGTIVRLESPSMAEPAWQGLSKAAEKYAMNLLSEPENLWFEGLETNITQIEYMAPSIGLTHPVIFQIG